VLAGISYDRLVNSIKSAVILHTTPSIGNVSDLYETMHEVASTVPGVEALKNVLYISNPIEAVTGITLGH